MEKIYTKEEMLEGRNPVFALEMIQTFQNVCERRRQKSCRNPVFALEMIQTLSGFSRDLVADLCVAIQYSPWR